MPRKEIIKNCDRQIEALLKLLLGLFRPVLQIFFAITDGPANNCKNLYLSPLSTINLSLLFNFHSLVLILCLFKKYGPIWPLFDYFRPFLNTTTNIVQSSTKNGKSLPGIRSLYCRMVGADISTELWGPLISCILCLFLSFFFSFKSLFSLFLSLLHLTCSPVPISLDCDPRQLDATTITIAASVTRLGDF